MAFVYENIDHARMQELLKQIPKHQVLSMSPIQVIDRDRDLVFVDLGGQGYQPQERGEPPNYYTLLWQGSPVLFEGYDNAKFLEERVKVDINLTKIIVPHKLNNLVPEIQQAIVDAMTSYWSGRWERSATVAVQFPVVQFY